MSERFYHPDGALISSGPTGTLRARLSARDSGDARPGMGDMHKAAADVLAGRDDVTVNGVRYRRDALGGVSVSTGPDLRAALAAPSAAPGVSPEVSKEVKGERPAVADPVAALTAHLPSTARESVEKPLANVNEGLASRKRAILARITGETP